MNWQRANTQAAAGYLREAFSKNPTDVRTKAIYEGLLDILEPTRRTLRLQREMATAAKAAATVHRTRAGRERRAASDRRMLKLQSAIGVERRKTQRRAGRERRNQS
jgi:hypothetical protein